MEKFIVLMNEFVDDGNLRSKEVFEIKERIESYFRQICLLDELPYTES